MKKNDIRYDICIICFNDPATDARALNIARTFEKYDKKTALLAFHTEADLFKESKIDYFPVKLDQGLRVRDKLKIFNKAVKKLKLKANVTLASDFYCLKSGIKTARRSRGKLIYDSREIYSALGPLHKNPLKQKLISLMEQYYVNFVDKFIVSGELDAKYLKKYFRTARPFEVIMNLPPQRTFKESKLIHEEANLDPDKKLILYQGALHPGRGIEPVMKAIKKMDNVIFAILGDGPYRNELENLANEIDINDKVKFFGNQAYDKLYDYSLSADIGICFIEPISFSYELALPNKLFEYMQAGLPQLVSDLPAMREIIKETNAGILIPTKASVEEIKQKIEYLLDEENAKKYRENALLASPRYIYEAQDAKILGLLNF